MASNRSQTIEAVATDRNIPQPADGPKNRRRSWRTLPMPSADISGASASIADPRSALLKGHDHEGLVNRSKHLVEDEDEDNSEHKDVVNKHASKQLGKMITPYLVEHIPKQYNPLGADARPQHGPTNANTKYCYRHRPDLLCRRQADEPSMEQLQEQDQQSIANVWSLFSAAPSKQRNLMLQGILAQCCFPQLSFISSSVRNLIKIDFLAALPTELGFKILCYLDTTSLCKAAQVSTRWRQLADDDVVWHRMCEQHIDRKCTKCGWGLPLLDQRRLRTEKRRIQLRASGRGLNEWSPNVTIVSGNPSPQISNQGPNMSQAAVSMKRAAPDASPLSEISPKRSCISEYRDQQESYFDQPKKRPWKDVYKDRFKVGTNWKYGRFSTTVLKGHTNGVMCLQFDDQILMTGSYDASVKVWDLTTGECIRTLTGHAQGIRCLQFDENRLITGSLDSTIKIWNWKTGHCIKTLPGHSRGVIGLHMADKLLASGSSDNTIMVHDWSTMQRFILRGHTDWVNAVKIDIPSRTLFSASDDCTVKLWDLDTRLCIKTFEGHVGQVQQVLPLPHDFEIDEQDFVAQANNDTSDTASLPSSESAYPHPRTTPDIPPDPLFPNDPTRPLPPSYMLTGSLDGTIRLWHVLSGRCVHRFFGHVEGVWSLAADSLRLVSGAEDKTIKIWDPRTGKHERTLTGHTGPVNCVGLSDSRLVSGSEDGTVRVHSFWSEGVMVDS
ncbi:sulfur metabolite repression control protein-like protein SconB [Lojkania enalia]|uniref:Sulfur metabolite repression control protein-like protein SconB n=1 Tax=Lojkania enalia TaxID=147567 RepID=A0A9P4N4Q9_9PLEO|nr:sulfur metabolite repression control protein-like protein SconB [Didymosphaeria enalia]